MVGGIAFKKQSGDAQSASKKPIRGKKAKTTGQGGANSSGRGRFVLTIGEEGAILIFMRGSVVVRRLFAPSAQPTHTEAMVELMQANAKSPLVVLIDVLDQQYVRQSFPPVSSLSVGGLVKRRLDRDFQAEDIKGSLPLGRDKAGRKEWNFLLIALAKTPLLNAWLDLLLELPNQLKGLYLLPVEATRFIGTLQKQLSTQKPQSWQLLVSHHKVSGFRQVVLRDGHLAFTRVTQAIDDAIPAVVGGNIEQEIINTIEYLRRLGLQDNAMLEAYIIVSPDVRDALDMKRFNLASAQVLTPLDVAENLGLEQAALSADRFGDVVVAAAIGRDKKRVLTLSTAYADKLRQLYQISIGTRALAALVVIAFLGMAAMNVLSMLEAKSAATEAVDKLKKLQPDIASKKNTVDGLNKDISFKTAIVAVYDSYLKTPQSPLTFVSELAPIIGTNVRILSIDWVMAGAAKTGGNTAAQGGAAPAPGTNTAAGPVEARVSFDFTGGYKNAKELQKAAEALLAVLNEKLPLYDVTHEAFPWESDIKKTQEISFDQQTNDEGKPVATGPAIFVFRGPKVKNATATAKPAGAP